MVKELIDEEKKVADETFQKLNDDMSNINERIDSALKVTITKASGEVGQW
jgi:hypothetical protein